MQLKVRKTEVHPCKEEFSELWEDFACIEGGEGIDTYYRARAISKLHRLVKSDAFQSYYLAHEWLN